jgi:hypothetical protein
MSPRVLTLKVFFGIILIVNVHAGMFMAYLYFSASACVHIFHTFSYVYTKFFKVITHVLLLVELHWHNGTYIVV